MKRQPTTDDLIEWLVADAEHSAKQCGRGMPGSSWQARHRERVRLAVQILAFLSPFAARAVREHHADMLKD